MIIMKSSSLKVLKALIAEGQMNSGALVKKTGLSAASVSKAIKELSEKGLADSKDGTVMLIANSATHELKEAAEAFDLEFLLRERKEEIIILLTKPMAFRELLESTRLSGVQLSRHLKDFAAIGAITRDGETISLGKRTIKLAEELKKMHDMKSVEPNAKVIFSGKQILKKLPLGAPAKGSPTAFSLFGKHGVQYAAISDFYVEPEHEVTLEEALVHAIASSEAKKDLAMCIIFYAKNKDSLDLQKLTKLAIEFRILSTVLDCIALAEGREPKNREMFLPKAELNALARDYGLKSGGREKFTAKQLEELLAEIGQSLEKNFKAYLIGGCNMSLQGMKASTKDIDLVVETKKDFESLSATLLKIGFRQSKNAPKAYEKMSPSGIFENKNRPRIDVFTKIVCNALHLSKEIMEKSRPRQYGKLTIKFISPESIILFKAITEREGDLEDIATIMRREKPDWEFFMDELERQHGHTKRLFCIDVLDNLEILEKNENLKMPKMAGLLTTCLKQSILFMAKKPVTVKEILGKIDFPETSVRNAITRLVKEGKLRKTGEKPFKVIAINI